jgi:hypothetical protein
MNIIRAPFVKQVRGECFMCWEKAQCMKIGPIEKTRVCQICYAHPCFESLLDDMFEAYAQEREALIDAAYVECKRTK